MSSKLSNARAQEIKIRDNGSRIQVVEWALRRGFHLYAAKPGTKHAWYSLGFAGLDPDIPPRPPIYWDPEGCREPRRWAGHDGPVLVRHSRDTVVLDIDLVEGDPGPGQASLEALGILPSHFATRSAKGTEHHWGRVPGGMRRAVCIRPGMDLLGNPDGKDVWVKLWDAGYEVISWGEPGEWNQSEDGVLSCGELPQWPDSVTSLRPRPRVSNAPARTAGGNTRASCAGGKARARSVGGVAIRRGISPPEAVPVGRYVLDGIPVGQQNQELWRSACSLAVAGRDQEQVLACLMDIARASEQDPSWPWTEGQLQAMASRALTWARSRGETITVVPPYKEERPRGDNKDQHALPLWPGCAPIEPGSSAAAVKWRAEMDDHPMSLDWRGVPDEIRDGYGYLMAEHRAGRRVAAGDLPGPVREHLRGQRAVVRPPECRKDHDPSCNSCYYRVSLSIEEDGQIIPVTDPDGCRRGPEKYPGWDSKAQGDPREGKKRMGELTWEHMLGICTRPGNEQLTHAQATRLLNSVDYRQENDLMEYQAVSRENGKKVIQRLRLAGEIHKIKTEESYRRRHQWWNIPAVYAPGPAPAASDEASEVTIEREIISLRETLKKTRRAGTPARRRKAREARSNATLPRSTGICFGSRRRSTARPASTLPPPAT